MRFIGNKEKLLDQIYSVVSSTGVNQGTFCDFFAGTSNVGRFFKEKGFAITSSDLLYFSYVLQKAYIENNSEPSFEKLLGKLNAKSAELFSTPFDLVRSYLNGVPDVEGFIYKNYTEEGTSQEKTPRKYFTAQNGKRIDAIRTRIEEWYRSEAINDNEYFVLLATLIESVPFYSNISGVYAAFLKSYDPRALKRFELKPISLYASRQKHTVLNGNSMNMLNSLDADILYLDPPYNERQYAPNYHLLETIARYDAPEIRGVTGMRDYSDQKSEFCNRDTALHALDTIAQKAKYKHLILSYNSEGVMPKEQILSTLRRYGDVDVKDIDYLRFKSNNNGDSKHKKVIQEQLYVLRPTYPKPLAQRAELF